MALRPDIIDSHRRKRDEELLRTSIELPLMPPEPMYPHRDEPSRDEEENHGSVIIIDMA